MASEEEKLEEFWKDASIPEGYFALEHAVDCMHAPEDPCNLAGTPRERHNQLEAELSRRGGRIIAGPRIRDGHNAYWVALPIPNNFTVSRHNDGYWVASCASEMSVETEEGVPYTMRVLHEGASKSKNIAIRRLLALVGAMARNVLGASPVIIAVVRSDEGFLQMPPGTFPFDTISMQ